jgi:hypothetical protein
MDVNSLGKNHFDWMVNTMADVMIDLALSNEETRKNYTWGKLTTKAKA